MSESDSYDSTGNDLFGGSLHHVDSVNKFGWKPPEPPELVRVVFKRFGEVRVVLGSGGFFAGR